MNFLFDLNKKNIIITGASSGIGRQCAITVSQLGANVILVGRDKERLYQTYSQLKKGNHLCFSQDITEYEKLEVIIKDSVSKLDKISGFIHSAGIEMTLPLKNMKFEYYNKLFSVNVFSGFEFAKLISKKKYLDKNGASIVFISSIMGIVGNGALTGYSATKGALISAVKSMSIELASRKIRVNCVSPGHIEIEMKGKFSHLLSEAQINSLKQKYPLGLGKPEDVSYICAFLLSDAARWITGTNIVIDGGYSAR